MSLPKYYFLSEETLRERDQDPKKFERKVAEIERSILEWDTDGGYAKLIQEAREESAVVSGDETTAEHIFTEKVSHMAAERYLESEREREEKEEAEERERKLAEKEWKEAEEAELRRRRRKKGKEPAPARKQGKEEEAAPARKRKRNKIDFAAIGLDPPPRGLADVIKERNEGVSDVKLVIMKELFKTDLTTNHGRLSMPEQQVIDGNFVTAEEDALISGPSPTGIRVQLIGPTEDETTEMMLKRWTINRSSSYVLNHNWNPLVLKFENVLKVGAIVQVWSFRTADGELRFQ
ncbi:B3 domain-containing protein At2g31420, partial [Linum grandiflorum]